MHFRNAKSSATFDVTIMPAGKTENNSFFKKKTEYRSYFVDYIIELKMAVMPDRINTATELSCT